MSRNVVVVDGAQIPSLQVFGEEITQECVVLG
jgi:hypothetical protein